MCIYLNSLIGIPCQSVAMEPVIDGPECNVSIVGNPSSSDNNGSEKQNGAYYENIGVLCKKFRVYDRNMMLQQLHAQFIKSLAFES